MKNEIEDRDNAILSYKSTNDQLRAASASDAGGSAAGSSSSRLDPNEKTRGSLTARLSCPVCMDDECEKSVMVLPCKHILMCSDCWKDTPAERRKKCSMCRGWVEKAVENVYY